MVKNKTGLNYTKMEKAARRTLPLIIIIKGKKNAVGLRDQKPDRMGSDKDGNGQINLSVYYPSRFRPGRCRSSYRSRNL